MKQRFLSLILIIVMLLTLGSCFGSESTTQTTATPPPPTDGSTLSVHFIDVGQADAALVFCDGKVLMIDGGDRSDSDLIYTYLKKHNVTHIDYMVCTHAHEDHVGGLPGALTYATVGTVYAPVTSHDTQVFSKFVSKVEERGSFITVPQPGTRFSLGAANVTILGPVKDYTETNNTSIILRVEFGKTSFLFTGDMEHDAEIDLIESGAMLSSTVLKVGHHGSSTSSSYRFVREVAPAYAVISVGTDNEYGHPNEDVLSRYRDADVKLYRTDLQGDIICTSDGETVSFATAKNSGIQTNPTEKPDDNTESDTVGCIGNKNSKIYHKPDCSHLPAESNRTEFKTTNDADEAGYRACEKCYP